jgi:hypothetical protein
VLFWPTYFERLYTGDTAARLLLTFPAFCFGCRFVARIVPLQTVCYLDEPDILTALAPLLAPHFEGLTGVSYAVQAKVRSNAAWDRLRLIRAVAAGIGHHHVVNLEQPQVWIIAEVVQVRCRAVPCRAVPCLAGTRSALAGGGVAVWW